MTLPEMIKSFQSLSDEEQDFLLEILCQHRAKAREKEILANFNQLKEANTSETAKTGTVEDLINDIDDTPDEVIIDGIKEGLKQAINGETIPLSKMWEGIDVE